VNETEAANPNSTTDPNNSGTRAGTCRVVSSLSLSVDFVARAIVYIVFLA